MNLTRWCVPLSIAPTPNSTNCLTPIRIELRCICMAKGLFDVECPCCQATLKVDPETRAVISHKVPEKPAPIEDLAAAVNKLKGEAGRRDEVFRKQVEAEKSRGQLLNTKFDELLRQAKENPDVTPPKRDIDLD